MSSAGEKEQKNAVLKFSGTPNEPESPKEKSRWKNFLKIIWPWAREGGRLLSKGKKLTEKYYEAEVSKKQNEAEKIAEEAANIAADTDLKNQQKVKLVNEEISRIFSDGDLPDVAKQLQLANLMAENPEIAEQMSKIEDMVLRMRTINFSKFELDIEDSNRIENKEETSKETDHE